MVSVDFTKQNKNNTTKIKKHNNPIMERSEWKLIILIIDYPSESTACTAARTTQSQSFRPI